MPTIYFIRKSAQLANFWTPQVNSRIAPVCHYGPNVHPQCTGFQFTACRHGKPARVKLVWSDNDASSDIFKLHTDLCHTKLLVLRYRTSYLTLVTNIGASPQSWLEALVKRDIHAISPPPTQFSKFSQNFIKMSEKHPWNHFKNQKNFSKNFSYLLIPKMYQWNSQKSFSSFRFFFFLEISQNHPKTISKYLYIFFCNIFNSSIISPKTFENYTENNVEFLKRFLQFWHNIFFIIPFSFFKFSWKLHKISTKFLQKHYHTFLKSCFKNFQKFL